MQPLQFQLTKRDRACLRKAKSPRMRVASAAAAVLGRSGVPYGLRMSMAGRCVRQKGSKKWACQTTEPSVALAGPASSMPAIRQALQWASGRYGPARVRREGDGFVVGSLGLRRTAPGHLDAVEGRPRRRIVLGRLEDDDLSVVVSTAHSSFPHAVRPYPLYRRTGWYGWGYPRSYPLLTGVERGAFVDGTGIV